MEGFFTPEGRVARIHLQSFAILTKRKFVASHTGKRLAGFANCLLLDQRIFDFLGQQEDVANTFLTLCDRYALFPFVVFTPKAGRKGRAQGFSFWLDQAGQQIVDWAVNALRFRCPGGTASTNNHCLVLFQKLWVRHSFIINVIRNSSHVEDIKWHIGASRLDMYDAAFTEGMTNTEFIEYVGIVNAHISNTEVGQQ